MEGLTLDFQFFQNAIGILIVSLILIRAILIFSNPLSKLPGPAISKFTDLRLKYEILRGKRNHYIHSLHVKYGTVVRISPSQVSTTDGAAVKDIYKAQSRFRRSPWYLGFTGVPPIISFTMMDPKQHAERRRLLAPGMSETNLQQLEPYVQDKVNLAMNGMKNEMSKHGCTDVWLWWLFMATDIIGDLSFGESFRILEKGKRDQYIQDLEGNARENMIRMELPWLLKMFPRISIAKNIRRAKERLAGYAQQSVERYKSLTESDPSYRKPTVFSKIVKSSEAGAVSEMDLFLEAMGFIQAGSDTTATTLTCLTWQLARRPDVQRILRAEIAALPDNFKSNDLKELRYLNQVIQETLRIYGAVMSSMPRVTPPEGCVINGHHIPGGVDISTQAYTLHRNEDIFPNSEEFIPERWEKVTPQMKDAWMAFGAGPHVCTGQHIARMELRLGIVHLLRTFPEKLEVADGAVLDAAADGHQKGMSDSDMELVDYFLTETKGHRCLIKGA